MAGINSGANLGEDVLISGTVGAALQRYVQGIPSLAVSIASLRPSSFDAAASLMVALVQQIDDGPLPNPH